MFCFFVAVPLASDDVLYAGTKLHYLKKARRNGFMSRWSSMKRE